MVVAATTVVLAAMLPTWYCCRRVRGGDWGFIDKLDPRASQSVNAPNHATVM